MIFTTEDTEDTEESSKFPMRNAESEVRVRRVIAEAPRERRPTIEMTIFEFHTGAIFARGA